MSVKHERDQLIKTWLQDAANDIKEALKSELKVETKSRNNDLVTHMDRQIEKDLVNKIRENYPNDKIVSEEGYGDNIDTIDMKEDTVWFLDPIDGTLNFVLQNENFAIMLAVYEENIGKQAYMLDVMKDQLYWSLKGEGVHCNDQLLPKMQDIPLAKGLFASNSMYISEEQMAFNASITKQAMGVRIIGSAALEAIELVKGNTVAYMPYGLKPWDLAAGWMMILESGGTVTRLDGSPIDLFKAEPTILSTLSAAQEIKSLL